MNVPPLLADWLQGLGPLFLVILWVIKQVLTAGGDERADKAARADDAEPEDGAVDPEGRPIEARVAPGGEAAPQQRAEVEEFLRRIGQLNDDQPAGDRRGRPLDPFEEPPRRRAAPATPQPAAAEIELLVEDEEPIEPTAEPPSREPASPLSEKRLAPSQLAEQAAHLGERIAQADEKFEARLHSKFDHRLGKLRDANPDGGGEPSAAETTDPGAKPASSAARVADMLAQPGGFRDAIVLSEILRRPSDDRW